ncbi:Acetyltransferase (GNAT) family protein [Litchfieldia salsa]|uniref:Acetyltransferase (GNAT) family protein n=2 Tax=Litchfieldia salsa TaxID=930152 RepID=A0A1H0U8N7_9BACI|nr:Acetyltransferase (GNAT) family protein [Litchfieldia salsa]
MEVEVIKGSEEQIDQISDLFNQYRIFYEQQSDLEGATAFIDERLKNKDSVIFLAVNKDRTEAYGFTQLYPSYSSVSMRKIWVLNDLYVTKASRRKGVAQALIAKANTLACETGAKGLALETGENNIHAQKLYESLGFEKEQGIYHYFLTV